MDNAWYALDAWTFVLVAVVSAVGLAFALGLCLSPIFLFRRRYSKTRLLYEVLRGFVLAIAIGILAWVVGYLSGASREPVVSALVPAILGAVGALGGFVSLKYDKTIVTGMTIISFAIMLFIGASMGGRIREEHELADRSLPPLNLLKRAARDEWEIKIYRQDLGLEWPPLPFPKQEK